VPDGVLRRVHEASGAELAVLHRAEGARTDEQAGLQSMPVERLVVDVPLVVLVAPVADHVEAAEETGMGVLPYRVGLRPQQGQQ
jgi:hypothetical protein